MHETRNFIMVLLLLASGLWALVAWFVLGDTAPLIVAQRVG